MSRGVAPRFSIAASFPLRSALLHVLSILRVPSDHISHEAADGQPATLQNSIRVVSGDGPNNNGGGVLPVLAALRASAEDEELRAFLGATDAATRASVNQWATLAARIAYAAPLAADEAEYQLGTTINATQEFLTSSSRATVADVLLYASLTSELEDRLPRLSKWASFVVKDAYVAPIARAARPSGCGAAAAQCGDAPSDSAAGSAKATTGSVLAAKPTAEEIERRRLEKEKAKAEKDRLQKEAASSDAVKGAAAATGNNPNQKSSNANKVDSVDIDIRVGRIESIDRHPEADKLFVETISLGPSEPARTIVSGLVDYYKAEDLQGALVLVVCNLKPKPLKGVTSHGMVLCASNESGLKIVSPPEGTQAGERVSFGGKLSATPPPIPSNAATTELLAHFKTTAEGQVVWKDQIAAVPKGPITSTLVNAVVK